MAMIEIEGQKMAISKAQAKELYEMFFQIEIDQHALTVCNGKFDIDTYIDTEYGLGQMFSIRKNNKDQYWMVLSRDGLEELKAYGVE